MKVGMKHWQFYLLRNTYKLCSVCETKHLGVLCEFNLEECVFTKALPLRKHETCYPEFIVLRKKQMENRIYTDFERTKCLLLWLTN